MAEQSNLQPVQDPIIRSHARAETVAQFLILAGTVVFSYWLFDFEKTLLILLVVAFALNTMNVIAGATSTNVQIPEVRDQLKKMRAGGNAT